jgi:hypothetical protein
MQRICITTKRELYEERKRQHVEAGYVIEHEQSIPINGLCSFVAVKADAAGADQ